jgi:hypothetical protein
MMDTLLLLALNGLIWGLIIALIALGLSIIFGLLAPSSSRSRFLQNTVASHTGSSAERPTNHRNSRL